MSWYLFYGRMVNMSKKEILCTPLGEMEDMIACMAIYNGAAKAKNTRKWKFEEVMALR